MPLDYTHSDRLYDANILRRMADHLESNVGDHEYNQGSPHRCAMGHAMAARIVTGWSDFHTQREWYDEYNRLFGGSPATRSRSEAIELLRAQADRLASSATD